MYGQKKKPTAKPNSVDTLIKKLAELSPSVDLLVASALGGYSLYASFVDSAKLVGLIKSVSNECLDIKVVPDLVQYATIKAVLEDLDGIPIISLSEVPLRGWNSMVKRVMDAVIGTAGLIALTPFLAAIAGLIIGLTIELLAVTLLERRQPEPLHDEHDICEECQRLICHYPTPCSGLRPGCGHDRSLCEECMLAACDECLEDLREQGVLSQYVFGPWGGGAA